MKIEELKEFIVKDRTTSYGGHQIVYRFPNNYGASVVNGSMLHSYSFYVELAVLKFKDNTDSFGLVYDTPITDDVEILSNDAELKEMLLRIQAL